MEGTRSKRRSILFRSAAVATVLVFLASGAIFYRTQRTLTGLADAAAADRGLAFSVKVLDSAAGGRAKPRFEPVGADLTADATLGAVFDGRLYLAGPAGLRIETTAGTVLQTMRPGIELPVAEITAMVPGRLRGMSKPVLLLATAGAGLLMLQPSQKGMPETLQLMPERAELRELSALLPLATGELLLGTQHGGLLVYDGAKLTPYKAGKETFASFDITALAAVDGASVLIGTRDRGVFYVHGGTVDHAGARNGLPDDQVEALTVANGHAYVGTPVGVADFDLAGGGFQAAGVLAPGMFGHALAAVGTSLAIGTLDEGLRSAALGNAGRFRRASITAGADAKGGGRVDSFFAGEDGGRYALEDGRLLRHGGGGWEPVFEAAARGLSDRNISALAFDSEERLFVGFFDHGVDILEVATGSALHHLEDDHLFCINRLALDPERHTMAAATANGLVLFDSAGRPRQTLTRRDGLISDHVTDIVFTANGTVLATPAGITFLKTMGAESLYGFEGLINNHVYALAGGAGDTVLAGTLGGLSLLRAGSVSRSYTVGNSGLKHNWITALLPLATGGYLVGTYGAGVERMSAAGEIAPVEMPAGLPRDLVINPNALFATGTHLYAGTLGHGFLVFSTASGRWAGVTEGLPSLNVTAFAAKDGVLYVGTGNGLVRVAEARLP